MGNATKRGVLRQALRKSRSTRFRNESHLLATDRSICVNARREPVHSTSRCARCGENASPVMCTLTPSHSTRFRNELQMLRRVR
jgi:hypothetical protein